jgi:hypothetical protein
MGPGMRSVSMMGSEMGTLSDESDSGEDGLRQNPFMDREQAEAGLATGLTYPASVWWRSRPDSAAGRSNVTIGAAQGTAPINFEMRDEKGGVWMERMHASNEDGDVNEESMRGSFMGEKANGMLRDEEVAGIRGPNTGNSVWDDPFTAGKRGTGVFMRSSEEERREGRWRNARSWVKGQVDRVESVGVRVRVGMGMGYNGRGANGEGRASSV